MQTPHIPLPRKFLVLPVLWGSPTVKQTRIDKRLDILQAVQAYFMDFMWPFLMPKLTRESRVSHEKASKNKFSSCSRAHCSPVLVSIAAQRPAKFESYRNRNQLESRLSDIEKTADSGRADEELVSDLSLLSFKKLTAGCLQEMESIALELQMLRMMDGACESYSRPVVPPAKTPVETFNPTQDAIQAPIFGTGYASLPPMSVDGWYEQHSQEEHLHDLGVMMKPSVEREF